MGAILRRAQQAMSAGDLTAAAGLYEAALRQRPREARLLHALGVVEARRGNTAEARRRLTRAVEIEPGLVEAWCDLAVTHRAAGELAEAARLLNRALARAPGHPHVVANLVEVHHMAGAFEECRRLLTPALESGGAMDPRVVLALARAAPRLGMAEQAIDALAGALADPALPKEARMLLRFERAALLDRAGRYEEAWRDAAEANGLKGARWDAAAHARSIDAIIAGTTRAAPERLRGGAPAGAAPGSPRPVLIVGPPRSGTTLVEQILAAHPRVAAGGEMTALHETARDVCLVTGAGAAAGPAGPWHVTAPERLTPDAVEAAAERYGRALAQSAARAGRPGAAVVTDKMPDNFLHLGLAALAAPGARVFVCSRDERDVAVSCWFLNFRGPYDWAYDLANIRAYLRDAARLIDHWRADPPLPLLDVRYEDVVADPDAHARRIVEFAGLEWDERCGRFWEADRVALTSSNDQVRRPVYTSSVGRWRAYERFL